MITTETITIDHIIPYLKTVAKDHLEETRFSHSENVDWDLYEALGKAKEMFAFLLKDSGKIVGYALFCISTNSRCKNVVEATGAGLYIDRPYRVRWSAKLLNLAISHLRILGVNGDIDIVTDSKPVGRWLRKLGGKNHYQVWSF